MILIETAILTAVFAYAILIFVWLIAWHKAPDEGITESSDGSIAVALHNEAGNVPALLACLRRQKAAAIALVDDHSADSTYNSLMSLVGRDSRFVVLRNTRPGGKKNALRTAVRSLHEAKVMAFTDADCQMADSWASTLCAKCESSHADMVIAPVAMLGDGSFLTHLFELDFLALQVCTAGSALAGMPFLCNGASLAVRREAYLSANLNDAFVSGDDVFLLSFLKQNGGKIVYAKSAQALVATRCPTTLKGFVRQRTRWFRKASGYTDWQMIVFPIVIFVSNMVWPVALILAACEAGSWCTAAAAIAAKFMTDSAVLWSGRKFWKIRVDSLTVATLFIVYPIYILLIVFSSLFKNKGRW